MSMFLESMNESCMVCIICSHNLGSVAISWSAICVCLVIRTGGIEESLCL